MELHIFRTNISTRQKVKQIKSLFKAIPFVLSWSIDQDDIDNVLKVRTKNVFQGEELIRLMKGHDVQCELLAD